MAQVQSNYSMSADTTVSTEYGSSTITEELRRSRSIADGTGADQADLRILDARTVADGATDAIDLTSTLTDVNGNAVVFAEVCEVYVINAPQTGAANTVNITVGGGSNAYAGIPQVTLAPARDFMMRDYSATGLGAVTDGTGDIINVVNAGGADVNYQIVVIGRTA